MPGLAQSHPPSPSLMRLLLSWSPFNKGQLATSCEDGIVRVWDMVLPSCQPSQGELIGHAAKVGLAPPHPPPHFPLPPYLTRPLPPSPPPLPSSPTSPPLPPPLHHPLPHAPLLPTPPPSRCPSLMSSGVGKQVFNVLWSPLLPNVLISGSDDCNVRVWDVASRTSKPLMGHTHNVSPCTLYYNSRISCSLSYKCIPVFPDSFD